MSRRSVSPLGSTKLKVRVATAPPPALGPAALRCFAVRVIASRYGYESAAAPASKYGGGRAAARGRPRRLLSRSDSDGDRHVSSVAPERACTLDAPLPSPCVRAARVKRRRYGAAVVGSAPRRGVQPAPLQRCSARARRSAGRRACCAARAAAGGLLRGRARCASAPGRRRRSRVSAAAAPARRPRAAHLGRAPGARGDPVRLHLAPGHLSCAPRLESCTLTEHARAVTLRGRASPRATRARTPPPPPSV